MEKWPQWNKNAAENVVCRTCEHFQRRDNTPGTTNCQGECRKNPPYWSADVRNITVPATGWKTAAFTFVPFGNTTWCSGYQRSLEANIPTMVDGKANCDDQDWPDWLTPYNNMVGGPPRTNKKPTTETCWYCEHFQRELVTPGAGNECTGYCMIGPPQNYENELHDSGAGSQQIGFAYNPPRIVNGAWMWCSKWERSRSAVPAPPQDAGVLCQPGG